MSQGNTKHVALAKNLKKNFVLQKGIEKFVPALNELFQRYKVVNDGKIFGNIYTNFLEGMSRTTRSQIFGHQA